MLQILKRRELLSDFVESIKSMNLSLGFVPTMGALHEGHLTLIKKSIEQNQYTLCSIFVNPTQFNNSEDLEKYPKTLDADIEKLKNIGCDAVYIPTVEDIYPQGIESEFVDLNSLDTVMEGLARPGHFAGVATVVKRLLLQVQPTKAYFGEKDFQQLQIIKQMVKAENILVEIIGVPTVREETGLAISSRNLRLTLEYKEKSIFIYQSLLKAKELAHAHTPSQVIKEIENSYAKSELQLEYFTIAEEETLQLPTAFEDNKKYRGFIVAHANDIRLIDNLQIK